MAGTPASQPPVPIADEPSPADRKPEYRHFNRRRDQPRLTPEQASRQGKVVSLALQSFPTPAAAMAFLNTDQAGLGRPLDLAIESVAGLAAVEQALALRSPAST